MLVTNLARAAYASAPSQWARPDCALHYGAAIALGAGGGALLGSQIDRSR